MLGYGPCYHMSTVIRDPYRVRQWLEISHGRGLGWDEMFAGFQSALDWPAAAYWRELAEHYPGAKVILTVETRTGGTTASARPSSPARWLKHGRCRCAAGSSGGWSPTVLRTSPSIPRWRGPPWWTACSAAASTTASMRSRSSNGTSPRWGHDPGRPAAGLRRRRRLATAVRVPRCPRPRRGLSPGQRTRSVASEASWQAAPAHRPRPLTARSSSLSRMPRPTTRRRTSATHRTPEPWGPITHSPFGDPAARVHQEGGVEHPWPPCSGSAEPTLSTAAAGFARGPSLRAGSWSARPRAPKRTALPRPGRVPETV